MLPTRSHADAASPPDLLYVIAALALCAAPPCHQDAKKVKVTVVAILASDRCSYVDPRLAGIAEEVRKKEPSLTGFVVAGMACESLGLNEKAKFPLVEGRCAEVQILQCQDKQGRVCLAVHPPLQGEIVYRVVCGKFLPIVTGCRTQEAVPPRTVAQALSLAHLPRGAGPAAAAQLLAHAATRDRLILAVCAEPCNGK